MLYALYETLKPWLIEHGLDSALQVFEQGSFRAFAAGLIAFAAVVIAGRPVIRWLRAKKIGDSGQTDAGALQATARSKKDTPTMGGLLIVGAVGLACATLGDIVSNFYLQLGLIVTLWLAAIGGVDDWLKLTAAARARRGLPGGGRQGLYAWEKLVFQLGLGLLVGVFAYRHGLAAEGPSLAHVVNLPFQKTFERVSGPPAAALWYMPMWLYVSICTVGIAGMSNAANISDGMDGLAAGVAAVAAVALGVLAAIAGDAETAQFLLLPHVTGSTELAVLAGALAGACLGFLWYNCSPASVFMGDTGALAIGGLLAYVGIIVRHEALLVLICLVFVAELGSVALQVGYFKLTGGKRIFKVAPYHHHLHMIGWTEQQVVARFWIITALLAMLALASIKLR
ncbi:MAG: phospho-N-acetylmuramoyl-pentapeptide-transferase [Planctomyces sp.]|nr:phospho-N-acetylmuramoyl-pentapeptide-transferase [Planctomyces sp.]MBA4039496.1 phospho-N-acetylmuramoyl-pentapeptide-transferase [Planctomyces sp.]MBA4120018.1 phospho-N-acetylmuramoyl-pentapeptide-transferase [Isosphaera sp.]